MEEVTEKKTGFIHEFYHKMQMHRVMLAYEGEFTQEIAKSVLAMTEKNLDNLGEDVVVKKKVFNVMVECLQNIVKHTDDKIDEFKTAVFLIGTDHENYVVSSGNLIRNDHIEGLRNKIMEINNLDKDGLKKLYKDIVTNGQLSDKGGAGLGLVDIARKSGRKLDYDFVTMDEDTSFYSLLIKIPRFAEVA